MNFRLRKIPPPIIDFIVYIINRLHPQIEVFQEMLDTIINLT